MQRANNGHFGLLIGVCGQPESLPSPVQAGGAQLDVVALAAFDPVRVRLPVRACARQTPGVRPTFLWKSLQKYCGSSNPRRKAMSLIESEVCASRSRARVSRMSRKY